MKSFLAGVVVTLLVLLVIAVWIARSGAIDMRADAAPGFFERRFTMSAMDASTDKHAPDVKNPLSPTEENMVAGAQLYLNHCAGCHGVPSNKESQFSNSFYPPAPGFFEDVPDMPENQNFYIIEHGVRWSGMPSWNQTLSQAQVWQLVTFLSNIQKLPPAALKAFETPAPQPAP